MLFLVDDQLSFLKSFTDAFDGKIKTFSHPNEALIRLAKDRPDILITDIYMPEIADNPGQHSRGMDGLTLAELARVIIPTIQIVLISGNSKEQIEAQYPNRLRNFNYFINKPLGDDFFDLLDKLKSAPNFVDVTLRLSREEMEKLEALGNGVIEESIYSILTEWMQSN